MTALPTEPQRLPFYRIIFPLVLFYWLQSLVGAKLRWPLSRFVPKPDDCTGVGRPHPYPSPRKLDARSSLGIPDRSVKMSTYAKKRFQQVDFIPMVPVSLTLLMASVTRFGKISRLHVFGNFVMVYFLFGKVLSHWANFHYCQWPIIENNRTIWSHCSWHQKNLNVSASDRACRVVDLTTKDSGSNPVIGCVY